MDEEEDTLDMMCLKCGALEFSGSEDGYFYCVQCGSQADDIIDTGVDDGDFVDKSTHGAVYQSSHRRKTTATIKTEPQFYTQSQSQPWPSLTPTRTPKKEEFDAPLNADPISAVGPTEPEDFALPVSYENCYNAVRMKYVRGLQLMLQLQCEALVEKSNVSPLILGFSGPIWLRYVAVTRVFDDGWADKCFEESEVQIEGESDKKKSRGKAKEPRNIHGKRGLMIWYRSLRKTLPLSSSLAISFLACHVAREPVLPTDITRWSTEGKLPYFAAFTEIEKNIGKPSAVCPLNSSLLFRPSHTISPQNLESLAASIADKIGLEMPPVNFRSIASRYLGKLSLPEENILSHACKVQIWSMPPDLWLSTSELRLPTRVCVMSILIVTIRILYNINGFGEWEKSLEDKGGASENSDPSTKELLQKLYAAIFDDDGLGYAYEFTEDLPTYLKYCKDVVFAGMGPGYDDNEEGDVINLLWDYYQKNKDSKPAEDQDRPSSSGFYPDRSNRDEMEKSPSQHKVASAASSKDRALRRLKLDMEENRFTYIPPRVKLKRLGYLHYERKRDDGSLAHVAHADYYILLRACARVAEVDVRVMHLGVLGLERRLAWLENRIEHCLHMKPPKISCEFCRDYGDDHVQDD